MAALQFQGSLVQLPDGDVFRSLDERMPLASDAASRPVVLTSDAPFVVNLAEMPAVHMLLIESDQPITVQVTSAAGVSQSLPVELLFVESRAVPITGIALIRVAGQTTTVRLTLGQGA